MVGKRFDSFGDAIGSCLGDVDTMVAVEFGCASDVPAIYAMAGPGSSVLRCFVDDNSCAGWREGSFVVVEGSVQLYFG
jgi:hypothetical protein